MTKQYNRYSQKINDRNFKILIWSLVGYTIVYAYHTLLNCVLKRVILLYRNEALIFFFETRSHHITHAGLEFVSLLP
jgi:hypothetical protein